MMITAYGDPAPKGSLKCVGRNGRHQLIEDNPKTKAWRERIAAAGRLAAARHGQIDGPIIVDATFTIERPASVPASKRPWPVTRSAGDVDKLLRLILDGLDDGGLYGDDAQIVTATACKCYPDTVGVPDRLDRPGVIIRIEGIPR